MRIPFFKRSAEKEAAPGAATPTIHYPTGRALRSSTVLPEHANVLRGVNGKMLRMYEAALSNNLNADFPISLSSGNAEVFTSLLGTRSRARTLDRDNPTAWAILESMRRNVGGHEPFRLKMRVGQKVEGEFVEETDVNDEIEAAWAEAGLPENCTTMGDMSRLELDLQAITSLVRDGGILWRHWRAFQGNDFRYAVQPLEYDRLDHYYNGKNAANGNDIKMSIEVDPRLGNKVVGYWLLNRHPGELFYIGNLRKQYREFVAKEELITLFDLRTRAEQVNAVSRMASIISRLHRGEQFDVAHVTAAIWSACKPFFILQELPTSMEFVPDFIKKAIAEGFENGQGQEGEQQDSLEPATMTRLPYGQKPFLLDPKFPIEAAEGFKKGQKRDAAAGSGTPYHDIASDLEGVNFSSGRLGENGFHDGCKILQEHFILSARRPHFNAWLKGYLLFGPTKIPIGRYKELCLAAKFLGRRWPYVNPLQDVQADILAVDAGFNSRDHVIENSDRGGDVDLVNAEISAGKVSDEAHGLNFDSEDQATKVTESTHEDDSGGTTDNGATGDQDKGKASKSGGKQTIKGKSKKPAVTRGSMARALRRMRMFRSVKAVNGE
jgi:lambda family phage portal protein